MNFIQFHKFDICLVGTWISDPWMKKNSTFIAKKGLPVAHVCQQPSRHKHRRHGWRTEQVTRWSVARTPSIQPHGKAWMERSGTKGCGFFGRLRETSKRGCEVTFFWGKRAVDIKCVQIIFLSLSLYIYIYWKLFCDYMICIYHLLPIPSMYGI